MPGFWKSGSKENSQRTEQFLINYFEPQIHIAMYKSDTDNTATPRWVIEYIFDILEWVYLSEEKDLRLEENPER